MLFLQTQPFPVSSREASPSEPTSIPKKEQPHRKGPARASGLPQIISRHRVNIRDNLAKTLLTRFLKESEQQIKSQQKRPIKTSTPDESGWRIGISLESSTSCYAVIPNGSIQSFYRHPKTTAVFVLTDLGGEKL